MNTEPVRTNGKIVASIVAAIVASSVAVEAAVVALLAALAMDPALVDAIGQIVQVLITVLGSAFAILKGAEATRKHTTAWDETVGAISPSGSEPVIHEVDAPEEGIG